MTESKPTLKMSHDIVLFTPADQTAIPVSIDEWASLKRKVRENGLWSAILNICATIFLGVTASAAYAAFISTDENHLINAIIVCICSFLLGIFFNIYALDKRKVSRKSVLDMMDIIENRYAKPSKPKDINAEDASKNDLKQDIKATKNGVPRPADPSNKAVLIAPPGKLLLEEAIPLLSYRLNDLRDAGRLRQEVPFWIWDEKCLVTELRLPGGWPAGLDIFFRSLENAQPMMSVRLMIRMKERLAWKQAKEELSKYGKSIYDNLSTIAQIEEKKWDELPVWYFDYPTSVKDEWTPGMIVDLAEKIVRAVLKAVPAIAG